MTKQPKEFEILPSPGGSIGTSGKWKENWKKIEAENKELLAHYLKDSGIAPLPWLDMTLFNPDEARSIFIQNMKNLSEQAGSKNEPHDHRLIDVQAFMSSTLAHFQKKTVTMNLRSAKKQSHRVEHPTPEGEENPFFYLLHQSYLLNEQFLKDAASRIDGLDPILSRKLTSYTRHLVDGLSLTAQPLSNVADLQGALASTTLLPDSNALRGNEKHIVSKSPGKGFELGENLAPTPGKVVFQNDLFQLIQYEPLTTEVAKRPLLIVPPWINKYYIFDLSAENSFVRWALESGLTVFIMSWVNPDEKHTYKTMADYVLDGVKVALDQVYQITAEEKVNVVGYCSGGTLLGCLMAYLGAKKDTRIGSATLMATPFDFSKIDELGIYRCEHQQQKLEEYVAIKGYLEGQYMVQAFNLLRTNDLIWSTDVNHYLLGQELFPFDMLYWICDALRMPVKMHKTYLRDILIENKLMKPGQLSIGDMPLDLRKITAPLFVMAADEDHISPWRSVYALTQMTKSPSHKFILSGSGHLKGVFNPPSSQKHHYWMTDSLPKEADNWLKEAKKQSGSWWKEWRKWLEAYEGGQVPARTISKSHILEDAPGSYAKE